MTITGSQDPNNPTANDPTSSTGTPQAMPAALTPPTPPMPTLAPQPTPQQSAQQPAKQTPPAQGAAPALTHTPANNTPASSLHARIFDGVLKTLSGGPVKVLQTDPTTGQSRVVEQPQSRSAMGKSILAAVLSGMFAGADARDPSGRHDPVAAATAGFQAGQAQTQKRDAKAQEVADQVVSRRQMVMKNNIDLAHQAIAMAHQQHVDLQSTVGRNQDGILKDVQAYDDLQSDPTQRILLAKGLTHEQALAKLNGNMTTQNAVIDGYVDVMNPDTKTLSPEPTYAILNPDAKVKMSEAQAAELAKFNPQYQNAYEATGGNLQIPVRNYLADVNKANTLANMESFFKRSGESLGLKSDFDLAAAVKKGGPSAMQAVLAAENAVGQQGTPIDALARIQSTPGGQGLLDSMGISAGQIRDMQNEQTRQQALAKKGGVGENAAAAQDQIHEVVGAVNNDPNLLASDKPILLANVPKPDKDGNINMTVGQVEKLTNRVASMVNTNKNVAEKNALANGDPVITAKTAKNIVDGDLNDLTKISNLHGNARQRLVDAAHDEAAARGLDTTRYTQQAMEAKVKMANSYQSADKGTVGSQIVSYNTLLKHSADANNATKALANKTIGLTRTPWLNEPLDYLARNVADDPDWKTYKTSLIPVQREIGNFLSAGYAQTEAEKAELERVLDPHETPARIQAALKQIATTGDLRLASLGQKYIDTMDTTFPHLLSDDGLNTLKNLGVQSQAAVYSRALPRGWQNNQPQQMTDKAMARAYFQAAGGNPQRAMDLAKHNGWVLNITK